MERTAIQCITYGLYMLSTVWEKKANGCIIDTCMQISHEPVQIAIAVSNQSYTCELLKKSGIFAVSILDETCTFETIKHFGYQSGRDVDKMKTLELPVNEQGIPYLGWQSVAMLGATVTEKISCGSHTLFIGTVIKSKILSEKAPLTYAEYQRRVKMYT